MTFYLIAQIKPPGAETGTPVPVESFETEAEVKAAYRKAMRELAEDGYSEDVRDFAIQRPAPDHTRERTAEEANVANALMAQFDGTHARTKGR